MIDGGAKFARTLRVPANEGGTHGPIGACVVTDGAVYVPLRTQDLAETLQRLIGGDFRGIAAIRIWRERRPSYPCGYCIPTFKPLASGICAPKVPLKIAKVRLRGVVFERSHRVPVLPHRKFGPLALVRCASESPTHMWTGDTLGDAERRSRQILEILSDKERAVCFWKAVGFSNEDIAGYICCSTASVERALAAARRKIADCCVSGAISDVGR